MDIFKAVKGTTEEVAAAIKSSGWEDWRRARLRDDRTTPLMHATPENMRFLVKEGFDVNTGTEGHHFDDKYFSALWYLSRRGSAEQIRTLIELGADVEAPDYEGVTPLMQASRSDKPENVAALIESGAKLEASLVRDNVTNCLNEPPGSTAIWFATKKTIQTLIDAGANIEARSSDGRTPIMYYQNPDKVQALLLAGANIEARTLDGRTPIMVTEHLDCLRVLIDAGADVNAYSWNGATALDWKIQDRMSAKTELLLAVGAKKGPGARGFQTAKSVRAAIMAGADVDYMVFQSEAGKRDDPNNLTLLMEASANRRLRKVRALLAVGADPNIANADGRTALMFASTAQDNGKVIQLLSDAGANLEARDLAGKTAVELTAAADEPENLRLLAALGADVNAATRTGSAPLLEAAGQPSAGALTRLIMVRADLETRDVYGRTALMMASRHGTAESIRALVAAGADIFAKDIFGNTALDHAKSRGLDDHAAILMEAEAANNAKANQPGHIPDMNALDAHSPDAAEILPPVILNDDPAAPRPTFRNDLSGQVLDLEPLLVLYHHFLNYANDDRYYEPAEDVYGGLAFEFVLRNLPAQYLTCWKLFKKTQGWRQVSGSTFQIDISSFAQLKDSSVDEGEIRPLGEVEGDPKLTEVVQTLSKWFDPETRYLLDVPGVLSLDMHPLMFLKKHKSLTYKRHIATIIEDLRSNHRRMQWRQEKDDVRWRWIR